MSKAVMGRPLAMVNFARVILQGKGLIEPARQMCLEAIALAPNDPEVLAFAQPIVNRGIGAWYFTMVQDEWRHGLYAKVLRKLLVNGGTVLDVGAGTGFFAMMAAREGADRVIACEIEPAVAAAAAQVIADNGLSDKITLLAMDSLDLKVGEHLDEPADILLWDNHGNNCIGNDCAKTLADAHARLIKPGAPILPARVEIMAAIVDSDRPGNDRMEMVDGFDMSAFNVLSPTDYTSESSHHTMLCEPVAVFDMDFTDPTPMQDTRNAIPVVLKEGRASGVLQWLRFHIDGETIYETLDKRVHAFGPQFHTFTPFDAAAGATVRLCGAHDTSETWFWVER